MLNLNPHETQSGQPAEKRPEPFVAQPCLIVAAGGFGHRAALNVKASLIATHGAMPSGIRIVAFDIDEENLVVQVNGQPVFLERDSEFFCLGPVPVARIRRNLAKLPTIRDSLPSLERLAPVEAARAAKQQRVLGQLALQWSFPRVRSILHEAIRQLAGRDQHGDGGMLVDADRGLKIIEMGSLCGGTNSGMFLSLGSIVRHELSALGILGDACSMIGVGLLPGPFRNTYGPNLIPNTVAALVELEHSTIRSHGPEVYRDGTVIENGRAPFDMFLLVNDVDEGGRVWVNYEDLARMVANAVLMLAVSRLGEQGDSELDNLDEALIQRTVDGHGTFFGSLGVATLTFPAETIVRLLSAHQARGLLRQGFLRGGNAAEARKAAGAWLQAAGLAADSLTSDLARDEDELPLAVDLELPASLARLPEHQAPQEAIAHVQAYNRLRTDGDHRAAVRHNRQTLAAQAAGRLASEVVSVANNPRQGLEQAQAFLAEVSAELQRRQAALAVRQQSIRADADQAAAALQDATGELIQSPEASWPFRRARVSAALDRYLQAARAEQTLRLELLVAEQAGTLLAAVAARGRELADQLAAVAGRLQAAADQLDAEVARLSRTLERRRGHPALAVVDEPYLEELFRRHAPETESALQGVLAALGDQGVFAWRSAATDEVVRALVDICRQSFVPILELSLEDVLAARSDFSPQARLAALLEEARPAWNLDETRLPGGDADLRRIKVVGVPDHARSIFAGNGQNLVSVHDPHSVLALQLVVGAPYTALQEWPTYLERYESARRQRPLHTLPAFQQEGKEAKLALALGVIFDQIFTRGAFFYYRPADELAPAQRLGQGASNAIQALAQNDSLVRELRDRVDAGIEHIGTGQAVGMLQDYCQPASGDDDLARELKKLVRDYADLLQSSARVAGARA